MTRLVLLGVLCGLCSTTRSVSNDNLDQQVEVSFQEMDDLQSAALGMTSFFLEHCDDNFLPGLEPSAKFGAERRHSMVDLQDASASASSLSCLVGHLVKAGICSIQGANLSGRRNDFLSVCLSRFLPG